MSVRVVGKMLDSFVDRQTGEMVTYARAYVEGEFEPTRRSGRKVEGVSAETLKIPIDLYNLIEVGTECDIVFNRYGRVTDLVPIDA